MSWTNGVCRSMFHRFVSRRWPRSLFRICLFVDGRRCYFCCLYCLRQRIDLIRIGIFVALSLLAWTRQFPSNRPCVKQKMRGVVFEVCFCATTTAEIDMHKLIIDDPAQNTINTFRRPTTSIHIFSMVIPTAIAICHCQTQNLVFVAVVQRCTYQCFCLIESLGR